MSYTLTKLALDLDADLSPCEKFTLIVISSHASDDGSGSYPSTATIAQKTGFNERTVRIAVRELIAKGLVSAAQEPGGRRLFSVNVKALEGGQKVTGGQVLTGGQKVTGEGGNFLPGEGGRKLPPNKSINKSINKSLSPSSDEDGECASAKPTHSPLPVFVFDPNLTDDATDEEEECPFPVSPKTRPTPSEPPFSLSSDPAPTASKIPPCPVQRMVDIFNEKCGDSMRRVRIISSSRRQALSSRWRFIFKDCECVTAEDCLKAWEGFIFRVQNSDFLMNRTEHKYRGGLDGLITERGFLNVIEGKYDNNR